MNILAYVEDLTALGYDPIPIVPGSKQPARQAWPTLPPSEQWQSASPDCNLALRHGGALRLASIEAERDRPEAIPALRRFLAGLGYDWQSYAANRTAHAGERYFFALLDAPPGDSRKLAADVGGGELRFGNGAQTLIPPSVLTDGGRYEMIGGGWDGELPKLLWADLVDLLADPRRRDEPMPEVTPTTASAFALALEAAEAEIADLPRSVYALLQGKNARTDYASTEEQRILAILVNAGKSFDACLLLFQRYECFGHFRKAYAKNPSRAIEDLRISYDAARQWTLTPSGTVTELAAAIARLEAQPFTGRTGAVDTAVLLSHLRIAHDAGVNTYAASMRRVAELAGVSRKCAERAAERLIEAGQIAVSRKPTPELATEYRLSARIVYPLPLVEQKEVGTLCVNSAADENQEEEEEDKRGALQRPPEPETGSVQKILGHDLFAWHGLGKGAGLVFVALPGTLEELAARSGRHLDTVKRALARLAAIRNAATGEVYALVEEDGAGVWQVVEGADVDKAARLLGVDGIGAKRRAKHEAERQRHAAALEASRGEVVPHPSQNRGDTGMTPAEVGRKARRKTYRENIGSPEADEFRLQTEALRP